MVREAVVLTKRGIVAVLLVLTACSAPITPDQPPDLQTRYADLSPGVALITSDREMGTGFFIDIDGTLVTAAHVLFEKTFAIDKSGKVEIQLTLKPNLKIHLLDGSIYSLDVDPTDPETVKRAAFDLAVVKKSVPVLTPRYLSVNQDGNLPKIGVHVIVIGYPAGSEGKQSLYEGHVSAVYMSHMAQGVTNDSPERPIFRTRSLIQAQMPITGGVSGAPLIDDSDKVIGVMIQTPALLPRDIQTLVQGYNPGQPLTEQLPSQSPVAALAWSVQNFLSPGLALAAPIRDLASGLDGLAASPQQEEIESPAPTDQRH